MTIEEDRAEIAHFRTFKQGPLPPLEERIGVAAADQIQAATRDSEQSLQVMLARGVMGFKYRDHAYGMNAEFAAALMRCMRAHCCPHVRDGGRELRAFLGARVITCSACAKGYEHIVEEQDERVKAGDDWLCDFCLEEADEFTPSGVQFGPVILVGDMCDNCYERSKQKP